MNPPGLIKEIKQAELGGKITIIFVSIGVSLSLSISQLRAPLGGGRAKRCAFLEGRMMLIDLKLS